MRSAKAWSRFNAIGQRIHDAVVRGSLARGGRRVHRPMPAGRTRRPYSPNRLKTTV
jgi:hypothetical protein